MTSVSGPTAAVADSPLSVLRECLHTAAAGSSDGAWLAAGDWGLTDRVRAFVSSCSDDLDEVPLLTRGAINTGLLRDGQLVRYVGMVQDQQNPEFFAAVMRETATDGSSSLRPALYVDDYQPTVGSSAEPVDGATRERVPVYCVPVPGESAWATAARGLRADASVARARASMAAAVSAGAAESAGGTSSPSRTARKRSTVRSRDDDDASDMAATGVDATPAAVGDGDVSMGDATSEASGTNNTTASPKRPRLRVRARRHAPAAPSGAAASDAAGAGTGAGAGAGASAAGVAAVPAPAACSDSLPASSAAAFDLHLPLGADTGSSTSTPPCLVRLYDVAAAKASSPSDAGEGVVAAAPMPKLNQVWEFLGILSVTPNLTMHKVSTPAPAAGSGSVDVDGVAASLAAFGFGSLTEPEEELGRNPPSSLVPRLHCLLRRQVCESSPAVEVRAGGSYEWLPAAAPPAPVPVVPSTPAADVAALRTAAVTHIANQLGGDKLLAEYVLLHMLSRIHTRTEGLALGSLTVNVVLSDEVASAEGAPPPAAVPTATGNAATGFALSRTSLAAAASPFGRKVAAVYDSVLPRCVPLPLSLPVLCSLQLVPVKDNLSNRLKSGPLQLPSGTAVIIDETVMAPGKLNKRAQDNLHALTSIATDRLVPYEFGYGQVINFSGDYPLLVLSVKAAALLPADVIVPYTPSAPLTAPGGADLPAVRAFVGRARLQSCLVAPDTAGSAAMEEAIRRARAAGADTPMLHTLATLCRLMAVSMGCEQVTPEAVARVVELDAARQARKPPRTRAQIQAAAAASSTTKK